MKSTILSILLALFLFCLSYTTTFGFVVRPSLVTPSAMPITTIITTDSHRRTTTTTSTTTTTTLNVFGNKKSQAQKEAASEIESKYWQGEWVCKDCGYIYNRAECSGLYFEEQGPGFRCPQCSGPRRRYAKKVGDRVGTTLDGGDAPILIFSFGGVALTIAFGIWAVNNL